mmetsp:Transcript_37997/g.68726  ORF Transcript_37997/g.68726 Transcript_37997/m.68726 type:complete len:275 (+) Transcript_37997:107-931(+)
MVVFGQKTAKQIIEQVAKNDAGLTTLDLSKSASFCMKSLENTLALSEALKTNTVIKTVIMRECEIVDEGAAALAEALAVNSTIEELDLQTNKLSTTGAISIALGLARNKSVKTLNLMDQSQKCLGEDALETMIAMFETNLVLTKIMWKVDSRRAWELAKLITRNVEIGRRQADGKSIEEILPTKLRGSGGTAPAAAPAPPARPVAAPAPAPTPVAAPVAKVPEKKLAAVPPPAEKPPPAPVAEPIEVEKDAAEDTEGAPQDLKPAADAPTETSD